MSFTPFERERRLAARIALYSGLVIVGLLSTMFYRIVNRAVPIAGDISWVEVDWESKPAVRLLQQFVRIASDPGGDEYAAALWLAGPLEAAGVPTTVERIGPRQANLWATVDGNGAAPLILLNHLDVEAVPEDEPWDHPPFAGVLEPPLIHGRGTFDMKSYTIAQLLSVLDRARDSDETARPVRLVATAEEETGSELGVQWLTREHPEVLEGAWAVLTEGGFVEARAVGDIKYWAIEFGQRNEVTLQACASSEERLLELRRDLTEYVYRDIGYSLVPAADAFLRAYRPSRDRENLREALGSLDRISIDPALTETLPPILRTSLRSEPYQSPPRLVGGTWTSTISLYLLPGVDAEEARHRLLPEWLLAGITIQRAERPVSAEPSPLDHPAFRGIADSLEERLPAEAFGPLFLTTARTDARYLRERGIPTYGWTPFDFQVTHTLRAGKAHEKSDLPGYTSGVDLYRALVGRLVATERNPG